jgi:hypothetical protein
LSVGTVALSVIVGSTVTRHNAMHAGHARTTARPRADEPPHRQGPKTDALTKNELPAWRMVRTDELTLSSERAIKFTPEPDSTTDNGQLNGQRTTDNGQPTTNSRQPRRRNEHKQATTANNPRPTPDAPDSSAAPSPSRAPSPGPPPTRPSVAS